MNLSGNFLICLLFLLVSCSSPQKKTFYISKDGDDTNIGSLKKPWKSIHRVNKVALKPGDQILFRGGDQFKGTLKISDDSGTPRQRILISSYGDGKAIIDAGDSSGIIIECCRNLTVSAIEIRGSGRITNKDGNGLSIGHSSKINVKNILAQGFRNAGCWIRGCDSVTIEKVVARQNGFCGIATDHQEISKNIRIQECLAVNNAGNPMITDNHSGSGILMASVHHGLVEFCEASFNGWDMPRTGNGPVGIWSWNSDSVVIQHCLSHHNKSPGLDGGGFDLDGGVTNSILQYNFSHHNSGSGYMLCQFTGARRPLANNHIRFNVSFDDGLSNHFAGIMIYTGGDLFTGSYIYHNTIINTLHSAVNSGGVPEFLQKPPAVHFYNNIFISGKEQILNSDLLQGSIFQGNLYWAYGDGGFLTGGITDFMEWTKKTACEVSEGRVVGLYADPQLAMTLETFPSSPADLPRCDVFKPGPGSPVFHTGIDILKKAGIHRGDRDFAGNTLKEHELFTGAFK